MVRYRGMLVCHLFLAMSAPTESSSHPGTLQPVWDKGSPRSVNWYDCFTGRVINTTLVPSGKDPSTLNLHLEVKGRC